MDYYNEEYLMHYGVKGMKWGVRRARQKEEYGLSKREVKKKIKEAKKNYRTKEDPYHAFSGVTGKNWAKVRAANIKEVNNDAEINELKRKRDKAYAAAERAASASEGIQKIQDANQKLKNTNVVNGNDPKSKTSSVLNFTSEMLQNEGDRYASQVNARISKIGEKYTKQYQNALLKDIGYEDLDLGRRMLNEYNIQNKWGKYNG